jgi:hypothetical protein
MRFVQQEEFEPEGNVHLSQNGMEPGSGELLVGEPAHLMDHLSA